MPNDVCSQVVAPVATAEHAQCTPEGRAPQSQSHKWGASGRQRSRGPIRPVPGEWVPTGRPTCPGEACWEVLHLGNVQCSLSDPKLPAQRHRLGEAGAGLVPSQGVFRVTKDGKDSGYKSRKYKNHIGGLSRGTAKLSCGQWLYGVLMGLPGHELHPALGPQRGLWRVSEARQGDGAVSP